MQANFASLFAANTYSYTLDYPVRVCIERLAARGFREFELMMYPGHLWPAHLDAAGRRELRAYVEGEGLKVGTLNMPNIDLNVAAATEEMRAMTLGILRGVVALAGDLGAGAVVIGTGKANPLLPMRKELMVDHFHKALAELVPLAADKGTSIVVENMPFGFLPRISEMLAAIEAYGDKRVGVVYDVANGHFVKEDPCEGLRACASRLKVVHLSDTNQSIYRHDAVGLGSVDFRPIPAVLAEIGFKSKPVLEIIATDPDAAIDDSVSKLCEAGWRQDA
ncbi:sugar phosphate isomerase/epimerase family protein [Variovorax sp. LjRoot178]|uniref:sugar phosphate isomerase/epimerase family protein n=1 Tax=Variovorax sp. LjRoot178 TaxID=3342277 RepID=UPI003ECD0D68